MQIFSLLYPQHPLSCQQMWWSLKCSNLISCQFRILKHGTPKLSSSATWFHGGLSRANQLPMEWFAAGACKEWVFLMCMLRGLFFTIICQAVCGWQYVYIWNLQILNEQIASSSAWFCQYFCLDMEPAKLKWTFISKLNLWRFITRKLITRGMIGWEDMQSVGLQIHVVGFRALAVVCYVRLIINELMKSHKLWSAQHEMYL